MIPMNCSFWELEAQVPVERNWWEEPVMFCMFCLPLFKVWLSNLQMNVPIGWVCYKTIGGLLFMGQVA